MSTTTAAFLTSNARKHACFAAFIAASSLAFHGTLTALVGYSLHNSSSSHIILIPFVSFFLLYLERRAVFSISATSIGSGIGLAIAGFLLYWLAIRGPIPRDGNWSLSVQTIALILVWVAGFIYFYGTAALRPG